MEVFMTGKRGIIAFFFIVFMFLGLYMSMLQRVVSEIAIKYSLDNTAMGLMIMMTFIGFVISPILTGEATDRYGRKIVLLFAFIIILSGFAMALLIDSPVGVGAGFFIAGLAFGVFEMTLSSVITDIRPEAANRILTYSRLLFALGTISGPFLAMGILSAAKDWIYVMLFLLIIFFVLFVVFLLLSYPTAKYPNMMVAEKSKSSVTITMLKNKILLLISLSVMMYIAVETGLTFYASKYIDQMNKGLLFSSLTLSVFWLCVAIGRVATARFNKNLHIVIGALALLAGAGLVVCLATSDLTLSIIAFGIMGFGASGMYPTMLAVGKIRFPQYTGTAYGIILSIGAIGGILHPIVMGAVADASNLKAALGVSLVPLLLIVILQIVLRTSDPDQPRQKSFQAEPGKKGN
jgi:fucose permease